MVELLSRNYFVDPRPSYPLQVLATNYYLDISQSQPDGYTLIFLHAVGTHKETWEVTIKRLLELSESANRKRPKIRDVFSIESPNHGESAVINEHALRQHFPDSWPTRALAGAVHAFLTATVSQRRPDLDISQRKLIGIGHSIGAPALLVRQVADLGHSHGCPFRFLTRDLTPRVTFESIIAIEPGISMKDLPEARMSSQMLTAWTWLRKDVWSSRAAAKRELSSSPVYNTWDPRVLDLFIKYGLRRHSAAKYPAPFSFNGVTTALTKEQEAATIRSEHLVVDAMEAYTIATREIPVHLIWGTIYDVATPGLQAVLSDESAGRTPASISYIEGAGHLVVQQKPEQVAEILLSILLGNFSHTAFKSQL